MLQEQLSKLRRPVTDDIPEITDIADKYQDHPLPTKFDSAAVVEKYGDIVAFAVLRRNVEALLYIEGNPRDKVEALKLLIEQAKSDAKVLHHEEIYVFAKDKEFANILIKHFNFRKAEGVPLILDL